MNNALRILFVGFFFLLFCFGESVFLSGNNTPNNSFPFAQFVFTRSVFAQPATSLGNTRNDLSDQPVNASNSEEPKYKVYVPSNDKGEPQGDHIYISLGLLKELRKASQERQSLQNRWTILGVKYQATFSAVPAATMSTTSSTVDASSMPGIVVSQFKATFEIELESESATLILPALPLQADGAKWNKQPIQPFFASNLSENTGTNPRVSDIDSNQMPAPSAVERNRQSGTAQSNLSQPNLAPSRSGSQSLLRRGENRGGEQLVFRLEHQTPGKHTLELMLAPLVEHVGPIGRRIAFPEIPKITDALLELNLSPEVPFVLAEEALGPTTQEPGTTITKLGPIDKLTLTWNDPFAQANQPRVECEQFFLLNARPNQISVSALYKFRIIGGKVQQLEIAADERMSPVGNPICEGNPDATLLSSEPNTPTPGITRLLFREPISGSLALRVNYVITNFSGIGVLRFPQIPRSRHQVVKSWLGITCVPTLELDLPSPPTVGVDQFKTIWEEETNEPLLAVYDLSTVDSLGNLSIRAKKSVVQGRLRHSILFRNNRANHIVDVRLNSEGPTYTHSFVIPENFSVEKVDAFASSSLNQDSYPVPIHWRLRTVDAPPQEQSPQEPSATHEISETQKDQTKYRVLSVFFERPLRGKHEISFRAFCPFQIDTSEKIPIVKINHVELSEYCVDLFRDRSIVVKESAISPNWTFVETNDRLKEPFSGIHFGRWFIQPLSLIPEPIPLTLLTLTSQSLNQNGLNPTNRADYFADESRITLTANIPEVLGKQYTYLNWNVRIERFDVESRFELDIVKGELNSLRLHYDKLCAPSPSIVPKMSAEPHTDEGKSFLVLTPEDPLHGKQTIVVKTTLNTTLDSTVFPRIDLGEPFQIEHYVILPSDVKAQPIKWEKNQLSSIAIEKSKEILNKMGLSSSSGLGSNSDFSESKENQEQETATGFSVADVLESRQHEKSSQEQSSQSLQNSEQISSTAFPKATMPHVSEKFEVFQVAGPEFSAYINPTGNIPTVQLNDVHIFLRQNGMISGVSSFDIRGEGTDHCILHLPESYELVSITSGGLTTQGIPVSTNRWRFDIWSSQFPQRVEIVFRGNLATKNSVDKRKDDLQARRKSDSFWNFLPTFSKTNKTVETDPDILNNDVLSLFQPKGLSSLKIELPRLESTNVLGTIWTLALENTESSPQALFYVDQGQNDDWNPRKLLQQNQLFQGQTFPSLFFGKSKPRQDSNNSNTSDNVNKSKRSKAETAIAPLKNRNSVPCMVQVNLIRLANMELLMNSVSNSGSTASPEDMTNWYSLWKRNWWEVYREITTLLLIQKSLDNPDWRETLFYSLDHLPEYMRRIANSSQKADQIFRETSDNYQKAVSNILSSQNQELQNRELENDITESSVFSAFRISHSENVAYLFGITNTEELTLEIYSIPNRSEFFTTLAENLAARISLMIIFGLGLVFLVHNLHPRRFFRQYPYFVGNAVAILLWVFLPPGFIGLILIPILWFAMLWPSWRRKYKRSNSVWQVEHGK